MSAEKRSFDILEKSKPKVLQCASKRERGLAVSTETVGSIDLRRWCLNNNDVCLHVICCLPTRVAFMGSIFTFYETYSIVSPCSCICRSISY